MDDLYKTRDNISYKGNERKVVSLNRWFAHMEDALQELFDTPIHFRYEGQPPETQIYRGDPPKKLSREHMPHGYAALLSIIGKLNYRWNRTDLDIDRMRGLVLIDELEVHLHVRMQKLVLPCLMKMFKGIQFVIATHSPFILNSVENVVIYDMENHRELTRNNSKIGANLPKNNYEINNSLEGWSINSIMDDLS